MAAPTAPTDDLATGAPARPWWETRPFVAFLILVSVVPLLYPANPPLVDLFGHMARYRVQLDLGSSPWLHQFYDFKWTPIGNLGVDVLVIPLSRVFGLELAVKLIALAIPPMTVAGFLWVAREVHHRLPPTALFALPFVYGYPFMFGFLNFALAMALAFLAFGLWLRLGARGKTRLRAGLFVPIAALIYFVHVYGWGILGLLAFSAEAVRQHDAGIRWFRAGAKAALHAMVMALPLGFMLAWRGAAGQGTLGWFEWSLKWKWIYSALRDRFELLDLASIALVGAILGFAYFNKRLTFSRNLAFSALVLLAAFAVIPWTLFGSAFADMRLVPYLMATALLAIRFRGETDMPMARSLAAIGLGFFLVRIAATTLSLALAANEQEAKLQALNQVPYGARLVTLIGMDCRRHWAVPRNSHLAGMATVRRHAFANDQWAIEGANLLSVRYRQAGHFASDPSQIVRPAECAADPLWSVDRALAELPRDAFDYVWAVDLPPPEDRRLMAGLRPVWRGDGSLLYAIDRPGGQSQP
jgi:hypothetical protein